MSVKSNKLFCIIISNLLFRILRLFQFVHLFPKPPLYYLILLNWQTSFGVNLQGSRNSIMMFLLQCQLILIAYQSSNWRFIFTIIDNFHLLFTIIYRMFLICHIRRLEEGWFANLFIKILLLRQLDTVLHIELLFPYVASFINL